MLRSIATTKRSKGCTRQDVEKTEFNNSFSEPQDFS
jgi:hypothetical protein